MKTSLIHERLSPPWRKPFALFQPFAVEAIPGPVNILSASAFETQHAIKLVACQLAFDGVREANGSFGAVATGRHRMQDDSFRTGRP